MNALSTPYDGQRRRLVWIERMEVFSSDVSVAHARRKIARNLQLSPDQVRNIQRGRLKHLYSDIAARIDRAFLALAQRAMRDLDHELAMASTGARGIDPGVVEDAKIAKGALEELISEAETVPPISTFQIERAAGGML